MSVVVSGSIATDYLMQFDGSFSEQIVPEQIHRLSVSFLVEDLEVRRGGNGANICFGLGQLGLRPVLVGSVGRDFDEYRDWLDAHGVDTGAVRVSDDRFTARFFCTTDREQNQIASFYAGAMSEAREVDIDPLLGGADLVVVSPNDPEAMLRHTRQARERGVPVLADPSQQLAFLEGPQVVELVTGARYLVVNDYELALIESKTGWDRDEVLSRVDVCIATHGASGSVIERAGEQPVMVDVVAPEREADPTGVGDAYRSGLVAGLTWGLSLERSAQVGSLLATLVLETVGTQEYQAEPDRLLARFQGAYGDEAAAEVRPHLSPGR